MALIKLSHPYTRGYKNGYIAGMQKMREIVDDAAINTRISGKNRMSLKRVPMLTLKAMESWRDLMESESYFMRWNIDKGDFEVWCEQRGGKHEAT